MTVSGPGGPDERGKVKRTPLTENQHGVPVHFQQVGVVASRLLTRLQNARAGIAEQNKAAFEAFLRTEEVLNRARAGADAKDHA